MTYCAALLQRSVTKQGYKLKPFAPKTSKNFTLRNQSLFILLTKPLSYEKNSCTNMFPSSSDGMHGTLVGPGAR